ncbi:hypothetical protein QCA50_010962 [Cerrena zonata]|uniref:Uncharacterized protein n=1 Tax=Cerrena zonata TaxID=2478898 RepID=A0AAW0G4S3_9APHY
MVQEWQFCMANQSFIFECCNVPIWYYFPKNFKPRYRLAKDLFPSVDTLKKLTEMKVLSYFNDIADVKYDPLSYQHPSETIWDFLSRHQKEQNEHQ